MGLPELFRASYAQFKNNFGQKNKQYKNKISMEHKGYDGNNGDCHKAVQGSMYSNAHKCNCTAVYLRLRSQVIQKVNSNDAMQSNVCQELRKVMEIELNTLKSLQNLK